MDLSPEMRKLERAGIRTFVHLHEPWPKAVPRPKRTSTFNWNNKLL
jgi:putative protease